MNRPKGQEGAAGNKLRPPGGGGGSDVPAQNLLTDQTAIINTYLASKTGTVDLLGRSYKLQYPLVIPASLGRLTNFHIVRNPDFAGVVTASTLAGITDTTAAWTTDQWGKARGINNATTNKWVLITAGTGVGQAMGIITNNATTLTVGSIGDNAIWAPLPVGGTYSIRNRTASPFVSSISGTTVVLNGSYYTVNNVVTPPANNAYAGKVISYRGSMATIASNVGLTLTLSAAFSPVPVVSASFRAAILDATSLATGTVSAATNPTLTSSSANWVTNHWVTDFLVDAQGQLQRVASNTATTLTFVGAQAVPAQPVVGSSFQILSDQDIPGEKAGVGARNNYHIDLATDVDGFEMDHFTVVGTGGVYYAHDTEAQHGVHIAGSTNVNIHDFDIGHVWGDGLSYYDDPVVRFDVDPTLAQWAHDISSHDGTIHHIGRQGLNWNGLRDSEFYNLTLDVILRSLIDIEPAVDFVGGAWRVTFRDCTVLSVNNSLLANGNTHGKIGELDFLRVTCASQAGYSYGNLNSEEPKGRLHIEGCSTSGTATMLGSHPICTRYEYVDNNFAWANRADGGVSLQYVDSAYVRCSTVDDVQWFCVRSDSSHPIFGKDGSTFAPVRYGTKWDKLLPATVLVDCGVYIAPGRTLRAESTSFTITAANLTGGVPTVVIEPGGTLGGATYATRTSLFGTVTVGT